MLENQEKTEVKTPENNIPQEAEKPANTGFVDSENGGIDDFRKVLNIPVEKPEEKKDAKTFEKADPFGEILSSKSDDDADGIADLFDPEGEGMNELFEDSEALSEMCVELLDLGMNYASQAISGDWGQDEKYSIPDSRKRKLRKPLAKLLEKRAPKVSPELAFMVFVVALYSPQLIKAYGVRREKMNRRAEESKPSPMRVPGQSDPVPGPKMPEPQGITPDEANEYDDLIREMRSKGKVQNAPQNETVEEPKRRPGRPKGSKDTKPRKARSTTSSAKEKASSVKKGTTSSRTKKA